MARLIKSKDIFEIGGFLNHWFDSRISANKNIIITITGNTGSGKTFDALSCCEEWYKYKFNEEYNVDNVCFGIGELAKRINVLKKEGKLRKGEAFIFEEAGANFGNLDFQNKINKMFNYILQSFRSMNLVLIMTLPVLTMLNKSGRQLLHAHFVTAGIDFETKVSKVRPYFHQLNQHTGKSYWKYPRVKVNGKTITLQKLKFIKPSERLIELYEAKKETFVFDLTQDLVDAVDKDEREKKLKIAMSRKGLSEMESRIVDLLVKDKTKEEIAEILGCSLRNVNDRLNNAHKKGYDWKEYVKNQKMQLSSSVVSPTL
jgi:DNA-directed RNA polymerase specialized sigma24 family protein